MNHDKYESISGSKDSLEFEFTSEGNKGKFQKTVQFTQTNDPSIFNLGFGDKLENGEIDDLIRNDNQDRNKILATIAAIIYEFTAIYSEKKVFFSGSTPERTRLYRMAISLNLNELKKDFDIYGVNFDGNGYVVNSFVGNKNYDGFIVKRKLN